MAFPQINQMGEVLSTALMTHECVLTNTTSFARGPSNIQVRFNLIGGPMREKSARIARRVFYSLLALPASLLAQTPSRVREIDGLMTTLYERGQFNGSIIVAVGGKAIYRKGFGYADLRSRRPFTPATISNIGSVAKQFTAMAVMMLAEQHKLKYDDPVSKFIPELSATLSGVTLRHLLNHTSGIPDVGDLGIDHPRLTNDEVLRRLSKPGFLVSRPGEKYRYSNANYVLLAVIVERISGEHFADFLAEHIFRPCGMHSTFVYDGSPLDARLVATGYDQFGNRAGDDALMTGSSGMYSTVDDLLKWDQSLYTDRLVRQSTLADAFAAGHVAEGASTYGFAWNIDYQDGHKFVWHQGATGGYRALIERRLYEKTTILILTNKGNSKRLEIADAIMNILGGKPYTFPKRSIAATMYGLIRQGELRVAVKTYQLARAGRDTTYDLSEPELNSLGYQLLAGDHKTSDAIEIFKLNTVAYPASSNAFDSLAEAYEVNGNKELAIRNYRKAVALDPTNLHAVDMLKKLK
ncbi:MAG TPA: serine hydrolase [Gemmatimonadaceae bacterium]|nr:serine hydrolase [Gemmatimonadaceae bacterium]